MTRPSASRRRSPPAPAPAAPAVPQPVPGGLVWVSDDQPGYRRVGRGSDVHYVDPDGRRVRDEAVLARIRKLAIPPAYDQVWICRSPDGHLQATGRDARGRKQYRYHPLWQQQRGADKFAALQAFGAALPRVRRAVQRDLAGRDGRRPTRERVLATLVQLLDTTFVRIGNEEYARGNGSYGLTTLRTRHAGVHQDAIRLSFAGKGGVRHEVTLADRRVAAVVRRCKALPGQELFQYVDDDDGGVRRLTSADVNDYLSRVAGIHVTAKDFRTWHASVLALEFTRLACVGERVPGAARQVVAQVAARLRNTAAVCRKSYIHPAVLALAPALDDDDARASLLGQRWARAARSCGQALSAAERRLLALLGPPPRRAPAPAAADHGRATCQTRDDRPVANVSHRKASHAESLGFHDAQRAGRPSRREPAARRAGDG